MRRVRSINVLDTGLASGLANHALDRRMLASIAQNRCGDLLRFFRSTPAVSLGAHEELARAVRTDYCAVRGIEIARRRSSGGALYLDPGQLGFSLALRRPVLWRGATLEQLLIRCAYAVAQGLGRIGVRSRTKAPNDVEASGRKLASVYAAAEGRALLLHGTVLLDADVQSMIEALRLPTEKLSRDGLAAARDRVTSLHDCLGSRIDPATVQAALIEGLSAVLGLRFHSDPCPPGFAAPGAAEIDAERAAAHAVEWPDAGDAIESLVCTPGGTLRARATFDSGGTRFARVDVAADTHVEPRGLLGGLEDVLRGLPLPLAQAGVAHYLRRHPAQTPRWNARDLLALVRQAADKQALRARRGLTAAEASALMPHAAGPALGVEQVLERATVMLVPYCAKPAWCKWRHRDGCTECGRCEVGEAYRLARARNMRVTTIVNYEHLAATLAELRAARVAAYVGMCCRHFYVKRQRAFAAAGIPAVLLDIGGANCYELKQEARAYAGTFLAQSQIDAALLGKVMALVPARAGAGERTP